jgi:hypothetical protein
VPFEQMLPAAHTSPLVGPVHSPDAPQKPRSVSGSTHLPPQFTSPAWQVSAQLQFEHTCPSAQA